MSAVKAGVGWGVSRQEGQTAQPQDKLRPPQKKSVTALCFVMEKQGQGGEGGLTVCVMEGGGHPLPSFQGNSSVSGGGGVTVTVQGLCPVNEFA